MNYFQLKYNLKSLYNRLEYNSFTGNQLIKKIRKEFPFSECIINPCYTLSLTDNEYDITGCYIPWLDMKGLPCIEIEIWLPKFREDYELSKDNFDRNAWEQLVFDLLSVMGHEFVHMHQARNRHFAPGKRFRSKMNNKEIKEFQEYLGIPDEIDAYSYSAAAQMAWFLPKVSDISETSVYSWYTKAFKKNDKVFLMFEKKTKKYYNLLKRQYNETIRHSN